MIYARQPTDDEYRELRRMARQEVGRVSQRALLILLSARRTQVPELSAFFDLSCATVRLWIRRFNTQGPIGLYDDARSGRPRKSGVEAMRPIDLTAGGGIIVAEQRG